MQPSTFPHQTCTRRVSFLQRRFQVSPCQFTSPFTAAYKDTGGGNETAGFQFSLPDVTHLALVVLLGSHIWFWTWMAYLKPYDFFFPCGKGLLVVKVTQQTCNSWGEIVPSSRSLTTWWGQSDCPQCAGSRFLLKSVTQSESEGWVH